MVKNKKQMYIVVGAFVLALMLFTTTYAFFNYTRTGSQNIIKTGRIYFNSEQGTAMNLDNLFPIDPTATGIMNDNTKVGTVTINVVGDTTYGGGIEYLVSAVNVTNTIGSGQNEKILPISVAVSVESNSENDPATALGTADEDYFTDRGSTTSYYKVLATDSISEGEELLVGYIAPGATGVDGNMVIKAYIDKAKVAISDTYPEGDVTHTEGEEPNQTTVTDYTNGTTSTWVGDREVFTTEEWNSLQTNGVSFQVKVEANEGIWVEEPVVPGTIPSCPGCYFMYTENNYNYGSNGSTLADIASNNDTYSANYNDIVFRNGNTLSIANNQFLGFTVTNDRINKAYVCGTFGSMDNITPFCIEGIENGSANTELNKDYIISIYNSAYNRSNAPCSENMYGYACADGEEPYTEYFNCSYNSNIERFLQCDSNFDHENIGSIIFWNDIGYGEIVEIGNGYDHDCYIINTGEFYCVG